MLFLKSVSVFIISVTWSFMIACPTANILRPQPSGASTRIDHEESARSSISRNHSQSLETSVSQVGSLEKRGKNPDLSLVFFEPGSLLMPVQAAAEVLKDFYTGIALNSQGPWAKNAPRIWVRFTFGAIRLLMTATEGTTIPWDFVTWFALDMLRLTERGYTGLYTANFVHPTAGNAVWVSLYYCAIGPLTDLAAVGTPARVVSCLNPRAQAWLPTRGTPTR